MTLRLWRHTDILQLRRLDTLTFCDTINNRLKQLNWKGGMVGLWPLYESQVARRVGCGHIESYPGLLQRGRMTAHVSLYSHKSWRNAVWPHGLGALRIGSDLSSCRGPSMRGIALVCGCVYIYTVYVYCWPAYTYVYTCTSIYAWVGSDRKIKLSCETIRAAVSRNRCSMRRARWLILTLDQCQPMSSLQTDLGCPLCDKA